ncbi:DUF2244 domain-containing protein [Curvivirga aplysinae]|uniref:DUF2244 domain-containing protein n=1 Tax=Curvivirga aplysinae TaxID=2529852 RepID=UPI0012BD40C2|nr:DUF2244 domain-containing protein [Curvivirga aplysinae]MTI11153.1 DUF2244 domain-containing protein [Curvivirga aplysinae]
MTKDVEVYLDVKLRPHRSLSPRGFRNLLLFIAIILFFISFAFFLIGAWPILGFAGLDFILLYYAFKVNMNEARRLEHIRLTSQGLEIRRVSPKGEEKVTSIEPNWLQVAAIKRRGKSSAVRLRSHGKDIFVGSFLGPKACKKLADDIQQAVDEYRVGGALIWTSA